MQKTPLAATSLLVLLLSGCADWTGIYSRSTPVDANRLTIAATANGVRKNASWPELEWWTGYGDEQLNQLIGEGLKGNPSLKVAAARIRRAAAIAGLSEAKLYPRLDASASSTDQRFSKNGPYSADIAGHYKTDNRLGLDGSYELDLWGGNEAGFRSTLGSLHASEVDAQAARLELAAAIAQTYVRLAAEFDQLDISRDLLRQKQDIHALSAKLVGAGLVTEVESRQAQAAIAASQVEIIGSDERIALLRQDLAVLVGSGPDRGLAIERPRLRVSDSLDLPSELPAELIGRRPDIVAQRWRIEAATHAIDAAKAQFYPNINLKAFLGFQAIGLEHFLAAQSHTFGAGPAITLPIFDAGRLRSNLAQTTADLDINIEQYNGAVLSALRDIVGQLTSWRDNQGALSQERIAVTQLEEAYRLALLRYREGLNNYLTVLSAEGDLIAQRRQEARSRNRQYEISIALAHALGGGFAPQAAPRL